MAGLPHLAATAALACGFALAGCAGDGGTQAYGPAYGGRGSPPPLGPGASFANIGYATWRDDEPAYRLYPGDIMDVAVLSAPELNRTVTIQPDGRITMPLVPAIMAADRSVPEVEQTLAAAYSTQLVRPEVSIQVKQATPLRVFVGGEVDKPGVYDMPGDIDALQAVIMAGGFKVSARRQEVVIIRRGPGGQPMARTADLRLAASNPSRADAVPLRRFDIIYVPRSGIANIGVFVQQYLRDPLPIQFSYALNGNYINTR